MRNELVLETRPGLLFTLVALVVAASLIGSLAVRPRIRQEGLETCRTW